MEGQPPKRDLDKLAWESKRGKIKSICNAIYSELERLYEPEERFEKSWEIQNECLEYAGLTDDAIGVQYIAWHELIGSSPEYKFSPHFDVPGKNSIENFLRRKLQELKDTKK